MNDGGNSAHADTEHQTKGNDKQAITLDMCMSFWNEHLRPFKLATLGVLQLLGVSAARQRGTG
jgi:hypothetical protein